jgi:hypothetical protein
MNRSLWGSCRCIGGLDHECSAKTKGQTANPSAKEKRLTRLGWLEEACEYASATWPTSPPAQDPDTQQEGTVR